MNELNKLIGTAYVLGKSAEKDGLSSQDQKDELDAMLLKLNEILATRPTCGKEQRLFLDEVEKLKYEVVLGCDGLAKELGDDQPIIYGSDFTVNLQKVIKGE